MLQSAAKADVEVSPDPSLAAWQLEVFFLAGKGRMATSIHITTPLRTLLLYDLCRKMLCHTISFYHQANILQKQKPWILIINVCLKMSKP